MERRRGPEGRVGREPPPGLRFRPMQADDLAGVVAIERASFSNPWKERTFRNLLPREDAELWAAELEEEGIVGYFVLWFFGDEGELADIAVVEQHRGRGIGSFLLGRAMERARERGVGTLFLEVRASNERAASLYQARGFQTVSVRKDYYRKPREDAMVMVRSLW